MLGSKGGSTYRPPRGNQGEDVSVVETLSEPSLELSELSVVYIEKLEYLFGE